MQEQKRTFFLHKEQRNFNGKFYDDLIRKYGGEVSGKNPNKIL